MIAIWCCVFGCETAGMSHGHTWLDIQASVCWLRLWALAWMLIRLIGEGSVAWLGSEKWMSYLNILCNVDYDKKYMRWESISVGFADLEMALQMQTKHPVRGGYYWQWGWSLQMIKTAVWRVKDLCLTYSRHGMMRLMLLFVNVILHNFNVVLDSI